MTPTRLLEARETLSRLHLRKCRRLARHALKAQTGAEVAEMVQDFLTGKKR